jgi:hypothetical protein
MKELTELRDEQIKLIASELRRVFQMGLKQHPNDADNSEFYAPLIELDIAPNLLDKLTALIESGGEERQTEEDIYKCKKCAGSLARLDTSNGDPEGIRKDRICLNCGTVWGFTKADYYELESEENHKKPTDEEIKCPKCGCNKFAKVDDEYWCLNVNCKHEWLRDKQ